MAQEKNLLARKGRPAPEGFEPCWMVRGERSVFAETAGQFHDYANAGYEIPAPPKKKASKKKGKK